MDCARNIITANFSGGGTSATTAPLWQWDYGQVLCITGIDLPAAFEVHFSTNRMGGVSTVAVGADGQVTIPNDLLTIGKNLNAWIYLSDAQGEGETEYSILIPVKARPMPETYDAEVTGEFDDVVRQVSEYAQTAQTAADNAGASASAAATSADSAAASASEAESAKTAAETAQDKAEDAQSAAETAAQTATEKAQQTAQDAAQAALDAGRAESAAGRAEAAQTGAESAKADAETAAQGAAGSASAASASASSAGQAATSAAQSATAAAGSATTAQGAAQTATTKAGEASASASAAAASETAAVTAQQGAETAATNAGQSASTATAKASEAATSASNAAQSKTDAEAAATRAEQAAATLTVDSALSDTSVNPVQNKVITGELTDVKSEIGAAPITEIYKFTPNNTYNIIDTPQIKRFEDGKTYQLKVVIDSNVAVGTISLSTTSSSSGQYLYFKNNEAITAGTYYFTFTYSETVGHSIYLRLYLDATYTSCSDVVLSVIDDTTIRELIEQNRVAIATLDTPVENQITTFTPVSTYTVIDSPDLQRFKDGEKYAVYVTISEDVVSGTISLSKSSSSSGTVYTFVNAAPINAGTYRYEFEYDETWTSGGLYLRLYLDGSYTKCSSATIKKIEAYNLRDYTIVLGNEISVLRDDPNKYKYAIDNVLCIGDSLTEGIYDGGTYSPIKQGYPYYIGRMVNTEVTNGGYNGYTAQRWYNDKANLYTYTDYNFIVIWLGTNGGLTDTLDTDVNPYTDYNDYADTNTGCYCKLIEKIKAENPNCMIMLCNCFAGTTKAVTNAVISKIADKYSLIVADMSDMGTNNHPEWHNGTIPVHFGKAGYLISAKRIIDTASAYFEENPIRCEFGLSAFSRQ